MPNRNAFNTIMFNAAGTILSLDLSDSMASSDVRVLAAEKIVADILTPADLAELILDHRVFESVFFSDGIALLLSAHKVLPETVRITPWLTIERDRRNADPSSWTGV